MKFVALVLTCVALCIGTAFADTPTVPDHLQATSVTIKAGNSQGSGTLVTRKVGDDTVSFVWTAAHVVDGLRTVRRIVTADGGTRVVIEFKDPQIVQEFRDNGRRVGETVLDAKVVKFSNADFGQDLAVLMIRRLNAYPVSVSAKFKTNLNYVPPIGMEVSHCGSLLGQFGANSYTTGVLSQVGRTLTMGGANVQVFDQVTAVAFPGSSGGGMYEKQTGEYVGMLTLGVSQSQGFNFIVPVRRIHIFAKDAKIEWAISPDVKMPSLKEIEAMPVETDGVLPAGLPQAAAAPAGLVPSMVDDARSWVEPLLRFVR